MTSAYEQFLRAKVCQADEHGFVVDTAEINPNLRPHCKPIVQWALRGGRRAIFASFGLHKTTMQLEIVRLAAAHAGGPGLITLPLGVRQEFRRDAIEVLGWPSAPRFIRSWGEVDDPNAVYLTNYETVRDGKLDPQRFAATSLDEAACLRAFGGSKTFREFMRLYAGDGKSLNVRERSAGVRYRFVATATPSPNDYIELLAYAAYLGIMDVSAAKTRFFRRNSEKADELTIHPHKEREFWLWVASWALFMTKPSDLGPEFSDDGYELPPLAVRWHEVPSDHRDAGVERDGQGRLFRNASLGVSESAKEKRDSLQARVARLVEIIADDEERAGQTVPNEESSNDPRLSGRVPRDAQSAASSARQVVLSAERREDCQGESRVQGAEQGCDSRAAQGSVCERQGPDQRETSRATAERSCSETPEANPATSTGIRPDDRATQHDDAFGERSLRDLPDAAGEAGCRPRSRDGSHPGDPVRTLQLGPGAVQGQCASAASGSEVSDQIIVWCDLNDEQRACEQALTGANVSHISLYGSQHVDDRERLIDEWRAKRTAAFLSKASMYGAGVNLQQCHRVVFLGVNFKFHSFVQAIHRCHRFGQTQQVQIHIIYTEAERDVRRQLERKWSQHNEMVQKMTEIIRQYGLSHAAMSQALTRSLGVERCEIKGQNYTLVNNDCVLETRRMADASVDLILTSIPFSTQYEYSPNYADFGHTDTNAHFFEQMDFLTPDLLRVLKPGRLAAIHVKDRIVPGGMTGLGFQVVYPFHARCIEHYVRHGFAYMGMKTIVTDVVRENNQTYRLGWTEQCKDGSKMGFGMPEYLLLFRRPPTDTANSYADDPIVKVKDAYTRSRWQVDAHGFTRSSGNRAITAADLQGVQHDVIFKLFRDFAMANVYDFEHHVRLGEALEAAGRLPVTFMLLQPPSWHPDVWTDVTRMLTLNGAQSAKGKEMHLCALQFDIVDRAIEQWTMPGETVYDPFNGIGTTVYRAVLKGRKGIGCELSTPYWLDSAAYCRAAELQAAMPDLFAAIEREDEGRAA